MFVVDSIIGDMVVIEWDRETFNIPLALLPEGVKEGDCLDFDIKIDNESTKERIERIQDKAKRLWE